MALRQGTVTEVKHHSKEPFFDHSVTSRSLRKSIRREIKDYLMN